MCLKGFWRYLGLVRISSFSSPLAYLFLSLTLLEIEYIKFSTILSY